MNKIKVIVAGPRGKMGSEALRMIENEESLELVACLDHKYEGKIISEFNELPAMDAVIYTDIEKCLSEVEADVLIDLTTPEFGYKHTKAALHHGVRPVVGTTGFTDEQIEELSQLAEEKQLGVIIAPNFAIGAVLMMQFAKWAAK